MAEKVRAIMIVEIAGRPAEHVKQSLQAHIGLLKQRKDVLVVGETISEPKKMEIPGQNLSKEQEMYTCFAEVEIEVSDFNTLTQIVFDYMPSSIEVIEPGELSFSLTEATTYLNTLAGRLHRYDEIAKIAQFQVQQMAYKMQLMQQEKGVDKVAKKKVEKNKPKIKAKKK